MATFDVFVIGTGTAGETAAAMLREAGLSVGIADRSAFGGTCALRGCQPKKYLVVPAHAALEGAGLVERGFDHAPALDWGTMQRARASFTNAVPEQTEAGFRKLGIVPYHAACRFVDTETVACGDEHITARRFLIATGARPRPLPIPGGDLAVSSDAFLYLDDLPMHVTFIGGGYVSMEFATVAAAAGSRVTVLQRGPRIMERFDSDLVDALQESCAMREMDIRTNVSTDSIERLGDGRFRVHFRDGDGGARYVDTELVVAALGRTPNVEELDLSAAGIGASPRGIEADAHMRTRVPHIYAAGDCVAGIQLSPVSDAQARVAARNIISDLGAASSTDAPAPPRAALDLSVLPTVVFTYPQLAQFGIGEEDAAERESVRVVRGSGAGWPNYRRLNERHMQFKVMIDEATDRIVGAHILAPQAGELVNLLALAARHGVPASDVRELPFAYPTYTADLKYMLA